MKTKKRKTLIIVCALALAALLLVGCTQDTAALEYIGTENASSLALEAAGLTAGQVEQISAELSSKNGVDYYDVELTVDGVQYEFDVDALTGVIIESENVNATAENTTQVVSKVASTLEATETNTSTEDAAAAEAEASSSAGTDTAATSIITADEAKAIALADAGLTEGEVTIVKCKLDYDNGQQVYDVEFYTAAYDEYDYEISAATGAIVDFDFDPAKTTSANTGSTAAAGSSGTTSASASTGSSSTTSGSSSSGSSATSSGSTGTSGSSTTNDSTSSSSSTTTTSTLITESEARSIALSSAGVSESAATFTKTKLDTDDGRKVYDVEFYTTDAEYEYEIDASTGAVLDSDYEVRYTASTSTSTSTTTITADEAKAIALAQVPGATTSNIREFETDYDDGRLQYEGKIIYNGMEYEFEIDGYSGAIRSWEAERAD
ncbi:MAG: PepSY domain-containing protein [Oscillospiraceae bacterium]|nr:PepSY domain-containing protein [Oscillospiraceae bacterium]